MDWLHPFGLIINGVLERGLEIAVVDGIIQEIRSSNHKPEPFVLSPAFVNAHSHLEYRGMLDQIEHPEYYEWIYELTRLKSLETEEFVREQCTRAARENVEAGVAWIGEHSDRPGSAEAMVRHGLGGWIFQEVITAGSPDPATTLTDIEAKLFRTTNVLAAENLSEANQVKMPLRMERPVSEERSEPGEGKTTRLRIGSSLSPHAYFTVDHNTLRHLGASNQPSSIHLAETVHESNFTHSGKGPLAERRDAKGIKYEIYGQSVTEVLDDLGVLRPGMQCVHCCDVNQHDIEILAKRGVTIAHCPRSNFRLQCPNAPVREFLDAGITVGLGMDSPASGGKIDMFAEMRAALSTSNRRGKPLTAEEVWRLATSEGYRSFGHPGQTKWDIFEGSATPLKRIKTNGATNLKDLILLGSL